MKNEKGGGVIKEKKRFVNRYRTVLLLSLLYSFVNPSLAVVRRYTDHLKHHSRYFSAGLIEYWMRPQQYTAQIFVRVMYWLSPSRWPSGLSTFLVGLPDATFQRSVV